MLRLGVCLKSLGLPLRRGLEEVRRLGVGGIEIEVAGDLAPRNLSQTGRREVRHLVQSHALEVTAVACPLRRGLDAPDDLELRLEYVQDVMSLSYDLGPAIVIVQAGRIPEKNDDPRAGFLVESLRVLSQYGDRVGATLAVDTGLDAGEALGSFLDCFDTGSLKVNFAPANLLVAGFSPYESARALRGRIVHAHASDARQTSASRAAQEVPLGHGDIDWLCLLGVFEEIGYQGWLTIKRESGDKRLSDIAAGAAFLRRLM